MNNIIKCPECKGEITELINRQSGFNYYYMDASGNYVHKEFQEDNEYNEWACPLCDEVIADSEDEGIKLLEGEK